MTDYDNIPLPPLDSPLFEARDLDPPADDMDHHDELELDAGFEISPFSGPVISLRFGSGFPLTIHRGFLLKSARLALLCEATTKTLDLRHISGGAGHILVQYFYTNRYQALEWTGTPRPDASVLRFKISVEVYASARSYQLDGLEELAKGQIEHEGAGLHAFTIIDAVRESYPKPTQDDLWFPSYLKSRIKGAFEEPAALMSAPFPFDFEDSMSIAKVVFRGMLEVYCEMLESLTRNTTEASDTLTPSTEPSLEHDDNDVPPVLETPEPDEEIQDKRPASPKGKRVLILDEHEDHQVIVDEQPPIEESSVPFTFEDHQADPEVALGFRYRFPGKESEMDLDGIYQAGPSVERDIDPKPNPKPTLDPAAVDEPNHVPNRESKPRQESKSEYQAITDSIPVIDPVATPAKDSTRQPTPVFTPTRDPTSAPERLTPSPPKDGDVDFWASLSRRRKEKLARSRRSTVTFELPPPEPPLEESTEDHSLQQKGKKPMSTQIEPAEQFGPELTSSPHQTERPLLPPVEPTKGPPESPEPEPEAHDDCTDHTAGASLIDTESEPAAGAALTQDDQDPWNQLDTARSISPTTPKNKKKKKKSKKMKALNEEREQTEQIPAERVDHAREWDGPLPEVFPVEFGHDLAQAKPVSRGEPVDAEQEQGVEEEPRPDPWSFWGAKRSPSSGFGPPIVWRGF